MSSGRLFQSFGPAEANEQSPTVMRRDGRLHSETVYLPECSHPSTPLLTELSVEIETNALPLH